MVDLYVPGTCIWIPDEKQVWVPARVVQTLCEGRLEIETEDANARTRTLDAKLELIYLRNDSAFSKSEACIGKAAKPPQASPEAAVREVATKGCDDLTQLVCLHEPAVLHNLQERFHSNSIYTFTGPILIAINPFKSMGEMYSEENLRRFIKAKNPPPHVFGTANQAFKGLCDQKRSQTVLISGESGAGKTETTKFVMKFLALAGAADERVSKIEKRVLESNPLLEAFGNARTLRNDNSSRFGKFIELQFQPQCTKNSQNGNKTHMRLKGAHIQSYLLEKIRVTDQQEGERNFHIFYQLCAAYLASKADENEGAEEVEESRAYYRFERRGIASSANRDLETSTASDSNSSSNGSEKRCGSRGAMRSSETTKGATTGATPGGAPLGPTAARNIDSVASNTSKPLTDEKVASSTSGRFKAHNTSRIYQDTVSSERRGREGRERRNSLAKKQGRPKMTPKQSPGESRRNSAASQAVSTIKGATTNSASIAAATTCDALSATGGENSAKPQETDVTTTALDSPCDDESTTELSCPVVASVNSVSCEEKRNNPVSCLADEKGDSVSFLADESGAADGSNTEDTSEAQTSPMARIKGNQRCRRSANIAFTVGSHSSVKLTKNSGSLSTEDTVVYPSSAEASRPQKGGESTPLADQSRGEQSANLSASAKREPKRLVQRLSSSGVKNVGRRMFSSSSGSSTVKGARKSPETKHEDLYFDLSKFEGSFEFLTKSSCSTLKHACDRDEFEHTLRAMLTIGMRFEDINQILCLIAAVLHLGNLTFVNLQGTENQPSGLCNENQSSGKDSSSCQQATPALNSYLSSTPGLSTTAGPFNTPNSSGKLSTQQHNPENFQLSTTSERVTVVRDATLKILTDLLGLTDETVLADALCHKVIDCGEERVMSDLRMDQVLDSRDALARHLYGLVFQDIVRKTNKSILSHEGINTICADGSYYNYTTPVGSSTLRSSGTILDAKDIYISEKLSAANTAASRVSCGVLDIFGFECFKVNSFEQLCINYANERLQKHFNDFVFQIEERLYHSEGVPWDGLDFPDNTSIVDILQEKPISFILGQGIFCILDEECVVPKGSDQGFVNKLFKHFKGKHPKFSHIRTSQTSFIVRHFAGDVLYQKNGFLDKNKDILNSDLIECMQCSQNSYLRTLFSFGASTGTYDADHRGGTHDQGTFFRTSSYFTGGGGRQSSNLVSHHANLGSKEINTSSRRASKQSKKVTVSAEFRDQLSNLFDTIRGTDPHFIRCIKSNSSNEPGIFERTLVTEQLRYSGVIQVIQISRSGYPVRIKHNELWNDYRLLLTRDARIVIEKVRKGGERVKQLLDFLEENLEGFRRTLSAEELVKLEGKDFHKSPGKNGKRKKWKPVDSKDGTAYAVCSSDTKFTAKKHQQQAATIFNFVVGETLVFFKKNAFGRLHGARLQRRQETCLLLQSYMRMRKVRESYKRIRNAVLRFQAIRRGVLQKRIFRVQIHEWRAATRIQARLRCWNCLVAYRRLRRDAATVNRLIRGAFVRKKVKAYKAHLAREKEREKRRQDREEKNAKKREQQAKERVAAMSSLSKERPTIENGAERADGVDPSTSNGLTDSPVDDNGSNSDARTKILRNVGGIKTFMPRPLQFNFFAPNSTANEAAMPDAASMILAGNKAIVQMKFTVENIVAGKFRMQSNRTPTSPGGMRSESVAAVPRGMPSNVVGCTAASSARDGGRDDGRRVSTQDTILQQECDAARPQGISSGLVPTIPPESAPISSRSLSAANRKIATPNILSQHPSEASSLPHAAAVVGGSSSSSSSSKTGEKNKKQKSSKHPKHEKSQAPSESKKKKTDKKDDSKKEHEQKNDESKKKKKKNESKKPKGKSSRDKSSSNVHQKEMIISGKHTPSVTRIATGQSQRYETCTSNFTLMKEKKSLPPTPDQGVRDLFTTQQAEIALQTRRAINGHSTPCIFGLPSGHATPNPGPGIAQITPGHPGPHQIQSTTIQGTVSRPSLGVPWVKQGGSTLVQASLPPPKLVAQRPSPGMPVPKFVVESAQLSAGAAGGVVSAAGPAQQNPHAALNAANFYGTTSMAPRKQNLMSLVSPVVTHPCHINKKPISPKTTAFHRYHPPTAASPAMPPTTSMTQASSPAYYASSSGSNYLGTNNNYHCHTAGANNYQFAGHSTAETNNILTQNTRTNGPSGRTPTTSSFTYNPVRRPGAY